LRQTMKRTRFARAGKPKVSEPTPHDRRATDLLRNAQVAVAVVPDPYGEPGEMIATVRDIRDDILARMFSAHEIDQSCFDAGRLYQKHAEHAQIGSVQAMDPGKVKVDGGGWGDVLSNAQINAVRALDGARDRLTPAGDDLMRAVLVGRAAFSRLAATTREATYLKVRFKYGLEILASLWGCTNRRIEDIPIPPRG
jgi:hypothetical protein